MAPEIVYLDTTVFADYVLGGTRQVRSIQAALTGRVARSTRYVREQFRATFLRAAILLYNQLLETRDPAEVLRRTDQFAFFTRGDGVKSRRVFARLLADDRSDWADKLASLERLIEQDLMREFDSLATGSDRTACCQCWGEPTRDENGFYRFTKSCTLKDPRPCRIEEFWVERHEELRRLASADGRLTSDGATAASRAAREVESGGLPRGKRCYVHLSDPVIIAEAEPGSLLMTSNASDFEPLTAVIAGSRAVINY
jgi:hypothetical protein